MVKLVSRKVVDDLARAGYQRHHKEVQQPIVGALETARLLDQRELVFQRRRYRVPPVPYRVAVEIIDVRVRIQELAAAKAPTSEVLLALNEAARLSKLACQPTGFLLRLLWLLPFYNPFKGATPYEVGYNLAFFSMCLGRDQNPDQQRETASRAPGTSSSTSPDSLAPSLAGVTRRGGRLVKTGASH
jgi:hypothetical protein